MIISLKIYSESWILFLVLKEIFDKLVELMAFLKEILKFFNGGDDKENS